MALGNIICHRQRSHLKVCLESVYFVKTENFFIKSNVD